MNSTKPTKDIRQCPLYPCYFADKEGHVYTADGKEVGVCLVSAGHLVTTTCPLGYIHRIVYYAFNPNAPVKGYVVHHLNEVKTDNRLENLQLLTRAEHTALHNFTPVLQYTMEGAFIAEHASVLEAERMTGVARQNISKVCLHKRKSTGGYIWRFKDDPLLPEQVSLHEGATRPKPLLQYTKEGMFITEYPSASEAERVTGVNHRNISMCCNHKRPTAGGYIWRFKSESLLN